MQYEFVCSFEGNLRAVDGSGHNHGVNQVSSTLHWGPSAGQNRFSMTHGDKYVVTLASTVYIIINAPSLINITPHLFMRKKKVAKCHQSLL